MTTKEKILKSALKLFTKQGIDKTSTQQISEDVGIASGTLFVHFKTKQDLIDAIYVSIKEKSFFGLGQLIDYKDTAEENINRISTSLIEYFVKNYNDFIFMVLIENAPQISQNARDTAAKGYKDIVNAVKKWKKEGELKDLDIILLGDVYWNLIMSVIRYSKVHKIKKVNKKHLTLIWEAMKH